MERFNKNHLHICEFYSWNLMGAMLSSAGETVVRCCGCRVVVTDEVCALQCDPVYVSGGMEVC